VKIRFSLNALVVAGLLCLPTAQRATAQDSYPNKAIRIIVSFSPGSGNDGVARELARLMYNDLGQPIVVENRVGAGGVIGTDAVAKAAPDGYTVGLGTSSQLVMNVALNEKLPFDIDKDITMVGLISRTQMAMLASAQGPKNIQDLIQMAKAKPASLNYGSGGSGSISHIVAEAFARKAGIEMTHIPYKGNGAALVDLIGGRIEILFDGISNGGPLADDGKARILAISGDNRQPQRPEVPTFKEAGLPGYEAYTWNSLFVPAGTPAPVIAKLNAALNKALATPELRDFMTQTGGEILGPSTPDQARDFAMKERATWVPFVKDMHITN
jgi:tripartite-type tricarboxylate transporter receptor subunit TctC